MSHPRVTVTVGRSGQRSATLSPVDAHSNRSGFHGNKKRSVKDRLGNDALGVSANSYQINKRQRQDINLKQKVYTKAGSRDIMLDTQNPRNDLRYKLEQKNLLRARQLSNGLANPVNDLRSRISGAAHPPQGQRIIIRKPPTLPMKTVPAVRPLPQQATAIASRIKAVQSVPVPVEQPTVATLLQSLGLGKYSIMFQAEEVDMAALRNMTDDDLKELGLPMGPRKKILLALSARK